MTETELERNKVLQFSMDEREECKFLRWEFGDS